MKNWLGILRVDEFGLMLQVVCVLSENKGRWPTQKEKDFAQVARGRREEGSVLHENIDYERLASKAPHGSS